MEISDAVQTDRVKGTDAEVVATDAARLKKLAYLDGDFILGRGYF